jgi:ATP-dependent RNA helicase RhlE
MPSKDLGLNSSLVHATHNMHFAEPTPIQAKAIPAILSGRDFLATAQIGTGKTAAYLLPILRRLLDQPRGITQVLITTPTRELAQQIDDVLLGLAYHTPLQVGLLGGHLGIGRARREKIAGPDRAPDRSTSAANLAARF